MISKKTKGSIRALWENVHVRRAASALFLCAVAVLILHEARTVEWQKVGLAIRSYRPGTLALAAAVTALSYLIYSCYDLLARRYAEVKLSAATVMSAAFVSFATNQSLGSLVGSVGFRFRIYSMLGIAPAKIARIAAFSIVTNWLGYAAVAGMIFSLGGLGLPTDVAVGSGWRVGASVLRIIGLALLVSAGAYVAFCSFARRRTITVKQTSIKVPAMSTAIVQLSISALHWPVAAAVVYVLFEGQVEFVVVLAALLLAAIAVVVTHIPAGLGVLEAVFIGLLGRRIAVPQILAALLVFRAIYYLAPLGVAGIVYLNLDARSSRAGDCKVASARTDTGSL